MKAITRVFLFFLTLISCLSCKQPVKLNEVDLGNQEVSVSISTHFSSLSLGLRSEASSRAQYIANDLRRISFNGIRVVFYSTDRDGTPKTVLKVFDKDIEYDKEGLRGADVNESIVDGGSLSLTIKDIRVPEDNYSVLIICNPTEEFKSRTREGQAFEALKEDFVQSPFDENGRLLMKFFTNSEKLIKISRDDLAGLQSHKVLRLRSEMKPNFAYASVFCNAPELPHGHTISNERLVFFRDVSNKKFRLFPEYKSVSLSNGKSAQYPIDANFLGMSGREEQQLRDNFAYAEDYVDKGIFFKSVTNVVEEKFQGFIIPENTMDGSDFHAKCVTRLILGVTYSPDPNIPIGQDWLTVDGKNYSRTTFERLATTIKGKSASSQTFEEKNIIKAYDILKPYFEKKAKSIEEGYSDKSIQYYKKGVSYYAIPIRHFKDSEVSGKKQTGRYGVVRNTLYMINITKISGPGHGDPLSFPLNMEYDGEEGTESKVTFSAPNIIEYSVEL